MLMIHYLFPSGTAAVKIGHSSVFSYGKMAYLLKTVAKKSKLEFQGCFGCICWCYEHKFTYILISKNTEMCRFYICKIVYNYCESGEHLLTLYIFVNLKYIILDVHPIECSLEC